MPFPFIDTSARIYVSGHAGMVGQSMLDLLQKEGFKNIIVRTVEELDLRDQRAVDTFFKHESPEYVFHFAATVGGIMASIENPGRFLYDNVIMPMNVIHSAYTYKVKKLINLGSSCMYPRDCTQPMKEEYLLSGKLEPTNEGYGIAKILSVKLCESYNKQYGTNFFSLIPCNIYGVHDRFGQLRSHVIAGLITKLCEAKERNKPLVQIWGTGVARREFINVADVARGALHFMKDYNASDLDFSYINLGVGTDISIKDLVALVARAVGYNGGFAWDTTKPDGMPQKLMDVSRMKKYHFSPEVDIEEGVRKTVQWYQEEKQRNSATLYQRMEALF